MQIGQDHLDFLQEAKQSFINYPFRETHTDSCGNYIALRMGFDRDCIQIFELGDEVAFFKQMIRPVKLKIEVVGEGE